jgi:hypothetical protein
MALATNKVSKTKHDDLAIVRQAVVAAGVTIYEGAMVSLNASGEAIVAVSTTKFGGIAQNYGVAGDTITLHYNHVEELPLATTVANIGVAVYATSDNVLTLTPNTCIVGYIVNIVDAATVAAHCTSRV